MMFYSVSKSIDMDYQQARKFENFGPAALILTETNLDEVKKVEPTRLLSLLLSPQSGSKWFDVYWEGKKGISFSISKDQHSKNTKT